VSTKPAPAPSDIALTIARGRRKLAPDLLAGLFIPNPCHGTPVLESKPIYTKIAIASVLVVVYMSMRAMGLGFGDLWEMVRNEIDQTRAETRAYRDSNFSEQVSREMRKEAARMSGDPAATGVDGELNNELATERKRMMEQSADAAEKNRNTMLKGDTETLKKQVRKNIHDAGGNN
jgi:hypothetical protein